MARPITRPEDIILDVWSPLSFKDVVGDNRLGVLGQGGIFNLAPSWVPTVERRRLSAYKLLAAYRLNVARVMLNLHLGDADAGPDGIRRQLIDGKSQHGRREYGDAALIIDRMVAGVLGDSVEIVVDGADQPLPDEPDLPEQPDPLGPDADPIEKRIFDEQQRRYTEHAAAAVDAWIAQYRDHPALVARQEALRQWADDEGLVAKLVEVEEDAVGLGDGVLTISWSSVHRRPVVCVYDPGFYFPVLTDDDTDPTKKHLAWEYMKTDPETGAQSKWVRRLTWELVPLDEPRKLPWNPSDEPSQVTCLFSDAEWRIEDIGSHKVTNLAPERAIYQTTEDGEEANQLDLGIDFIPLLHIPNTPATRTHWGQAAIAHVAQILDDLGGQDTDIRAAERLAAGPQVAVSGAVNIGARLVVQPGNVFKLGENGTMSVLDLSQSLPQLYTGRKDLSDRLSEVAKVPPEVLGRVRASNQISGVALALSFGPFSQVIEKMRLVRQAKYRTLITYAARLFQYGGDERFPAGVDMPAHLALGAYLPTDRKGVADTVVELVQAKALSRQTAVQMLVDAGYDIDDARHELDRIREDDTQGALQVAEATASEQLAADRLGVDLPERPVAPTIPTLKPPDDSGKPGPA